MIKDRDSFKIENIVDKWIKKKSHCYWWITNKDVCYFCTKKKDRNGI